MGPETGHDDTIDLRRAGVWLVVLAGVILASGAYIHPVDGHSFYLNINWHAGFLAELKSGAWYPRWLSTTNQGLGAPSFYFYAPLPFYVSAAVDLLWPFAHGPNFAPVGAALIAVVLSGLAMFALTRALHGAAVAAPVAVAFMAMPYHFGIDFWWRAAFGEIWAFVWLPLTAWGVVRQGKGEAGGALLAGVASAGMILSHLPSFVIGACGLGTIAVVAVAGVLAGRLDRVVVLRTLAGTGLALALAVLSTAIYWHPALATTELTFMREFMTQGWYAYENNFILSTRIAASNQSLNMIGLALLYAGGLCIWSIFRRQSARSMTFLMSTAVFGMSLFMTSPASLLVYDLLPPLQRLQFPWRFLLLTEIAFAVVLAQLLASTGFARAGRAPRRAVVAVIGGAAALLVCLALLLPAWMRHSYDEAGVARTDALLASRADGDEYRTRWTDAAFYAAIVNGRRIAPTAPRFSDDADDALLSGARSRPGTLVFNQFWYPDFAVRDRMTGRDLVTSAQPVTGLAMADVPAGAYDLVVERRVLPEVVVAHRLSLAGVLLALLWMGLQSLKLRRRDGAPGGKPAPLLAD